MIINTEFNNQKKFEDMDYGAVFIRNIDVTRMSHSLVYIKIPEVLNATIDDNGEYCATGKIFNAINAENGHPIEIGNLEVVTEFSNATLSLIGCKI